MHCSPLFPSLLDALPHADSPTQTMPIAVIGLAARFGGAPSLQAYWRLLIEGQSAITEVPAQRWPSAPGRQHMAALDGIDLFAAGFFGIGDQEAQVMDPQQRLMLELGYEALEDAGYTGARMPASRPVGVYVGANHNSYLEQILALQRQGAYTGNEHTQLLPGNILNVIAARLSHSLDLRGPALSLDTACSSSLVALHYACADLRAGQCDIALAGGVNIMTTPTGAQLLQQAGTVSPDGVCRAFDEGANGLVLGEGAAWLVLKRLDQALADGDRIEALIASTAINNDGRSLGIMTPTLEGQVDVVRQALAKAGLQASQIQYVEAHGTGTPIGDAVEVQALSRAFALPAGAPRCGIGSVKPNIGHPLAAAGMAGLIKLILALRHEQLPPTLNLKHPHPGLRLEQTPFEPVTSARPWPRSEAPRHAGVSAFGFGGTNAHAIVSDPPPPAARREAGPTPQLLCLSAQNTHELMALRMRLIEHLLAHPGISLIDLSFSTCMGREAFAQREHFVCFGLADALAQLQQLAPLQGAAAAQRPAGFTASRATVALRALGERWQRGQAVDWAAHFQGSGARIVALPAYPFSRRSHWLSGAPLPPRLAGLLAPCRAARESAADTAPCATEMGQSAQAQSAPPSEAPQDAAHEHVARLIEAELADHDIHCSDRQALFAHIGATSMVCMSTCDALAQRLDLPVPLSLFFEHGSVELLASHLVEQHRAEIEALLKAPAAAAPSGPAPTLAPAAPQRSARPR